MKWKHLVLLGFLLGAANACSDDDGEGMDDACLNACNKLSVCGQGVNCGGVTIPVSRCADLCRQRQATGAANCVIQVPRCSDTDKLSTCAAGMPCS